MKTNMKKYVAIFACLVLVIFGINFTSNNSLYATDSTTHGGSSGKIEGGSTTHKSDSGATHGGSSGKFEGGSTTHENYSGTTREGAVSQTTSSSSTQTKTGKNIEDATDLGTGVFDKSNGVIDRIETEGGAGTDNSDWQKKRFKNFNSALYRIWGGILVVLQIASIGGVIFVGVKYMFASADVKADLKKNMIHLVIGMIIVFGASTVIGFITGTFKDVFKPLL